MVVSPPAPKQWQLRIGGTTKHEMLCRLSELDVMLNDYARALFADPEFTTSTDIRDARLVQLRLQYLDQPQGPYLTVASPETRPGPETPNGFYLRHIDDVLCCGDTRPVRRTSTPRSSLISSLCSRKRRLRRRRSVGSATRWVKPSGEPLRCGD